MNLFTHPKLTHDFAHYVVRKSIINSLNKHLPSFTGVVVDLGCGNMPYKEMIKSITAVREYIGIDWPGTNFYSNKPDLVWDGITIPLEDCTIDCVLFTEVLEHLDDPLSVMKEIYRILKPGGIIVGTTPFLWLLHEVPNDMQRFTPFGIKRLIEKAGYRNHEIVGSGGWRTSLAQFICMYVGFGITNRIVKKGLKLLFHLPILYLTKHDHEVSEFRHANMINSTSFRAIK